MIFPKPSQDPNKLGQILNNLLSNAIKFTPEGGMITVRVSDLDNGRFRLLVSDTGVGIADEDQPIIFQKFRQSRKVLDGEGSDARVRRHRAGPVDRQGTGETARRRSRLRERIGTGKFVLGDSSLAARRPATDRFVVAIDHRNGNPRNTLLSIATGS